MIEYLIRTLRKQLEENYCVVALTTLNILEREMMKKEIERRCEKIRDKITAIVAPTLRRLDKH